MLNNTNYLRFELAFSLLLANNALASLNSNSTITLAPNHKATVLFSLGNTAFE